MVAGLQVTSGKLKVTGQHTFYFRVIRDGKVVLDAYDGEVELKRFKDVVHEVSACDGIKSRDSYYPW